jgi:hypothetical protein
MLDRYLENLTIYAETVCDPFEDNATSVKGHSLDVEEDGEHAEEAGTQNDSLVSTRQELW